MQVTADGAAHDAWALREVGSRQIDLTTISETERLANALLYARKVHQAHLPMCEVVCVQLRLEIEQKPKGQRACTSEK